jgi:hypothetical protein
MSLLKIISNYIINPRRNNKNFFQLTNIPISMKYLVSIFLQIFILNLEAGDYGDIYGAHPAANGMANAVVSSVNNSSAVYYNVAGLGRLSDGDKIFANIEKEKKDKEDEEKKITELIKEETQPEENELEPNSKNQTTKSLWKQIKKDSFLYTPFNRTLKTPHELSLQYSFARPQLSTSAPQNQDLTRVRDDYAGLGMTINLNSIYDLKRNIKFGLNVLLPGNGDLLTINDVNPTAHRYLQYGISNIKPTIMGGMGIELWKDRLFAGVGFNALVSGQGAILLKDVPISPETVTPNQQVILQTKPFVNPTFGLAFEYGKFQLGWSYRREIAMSVDGLPARAQTTLLGIQLDFDVSMYDHFSPRKMSYGFSYRPIQSLLFSMQIDKEMWSAFRLSRTKQTYSDNMYFNDILVTRGGIEYQAREWLKLRTGIAKRPKPTPAMTGNNNIMDFDRLIGTAGISVLLLPEKVLPNQKSPVILDLVFEYQKLTDEQVTKTFPTQRNPSYSMGGKVLHLGFAVTMFF